MNTPSDFLPQKGNYKDLVCYQKAKSIFDLTNFFVGKWLNKGDRTVDQMVQAARSGNRI